MHLGNVHPRARQAAVVALALEHLDRALGHVEHLVDSLRGVDQGALVGELDQHAGADGLRLGGACLLERCPQHLVAPLKSPLSLSALPSSSSTSGRRSRLNSNCSALGPAASRLRSGRLGAGHGARRSPGAPRPAPPAVGCDRPAARARAGTARPARGESQGTRCTPHRAALPIRRTARAARCATPWACSDRRRRGSGCGGSAAGPRRPAKLRSGWIRPPVHQRAQVLGGRRDAPRVRQQLVHRSRARTPARSPPHAR